MGMTYRCRVKSKPGELVEIDAGHQGKFFLGEDERPITSDLLGLALYLDVVNHENIEVTPIGDHPCKPEAAPKKKRKSKPLPPQRIKSDGERENEGGN
jgi:hypothetical protein